MLFTRTPADYPELLSHYQDLARKGKYRKAWEVCIAFARKCVLDGPQWMLGQESAKVHLLMANAALKASAFERAFFNAKTALLVFSRVNDPSADFRTGRITGSFADEMHEAEEIASDALENIGKGDIEGVQSEWEKIERDYERAGRAAYAWANLAVSWSLAGPLQKWRMRRRLKTIFKDGDLFGKWSTPDD